MTEQLYETICILMSVLSVVLVILITVGLPLVLIYAYSNSPLYFKRAKKIPDAVARYAVRPYNEELIKFMEKMSLIELEEKKIIGSDIRIIFLPFDFDKMPSAYSHAKTRTVLFNRAFARELYTHWDNADYISNYLATIAHECGHIQHHMRYNKYGFGKRGQFYNWIAEVYCDLCGSASLAKDPRAWVNAKRNVVYMRYRKLYRNPVKKITKCSKTHPSWEQRFVYVANYQFNEELWRQIARDVGYNITDIDINEIRRIYAI